MPLPPEHENQSYELLTSTRFDHLLSTLKWNNDCANPCPFFLLRYHFDRLLDAADRHGWSQVRGTLTYEIFKATCHGALAGNDTSQTFKVRLLLSKSGALMASVSPTIPFSSDPTSATFFNPTSDNISLFGDIFSIYVDSCPSPTSLFTTTKTTQRTVYNDARLRAGLSLSPDLSPMVDVLMYNSEKLITESSIFNVAFYHSPHWITPATSTGCLPGVLRRWLLEQGRIHEAKDSALAKDSIRIGDWVLLFNGVQGCRLGRITKFC